MAKYPRLKVTGIGWNASEEVREFEQARHFPFTHNVIIMVEGHVIRSYEELLELVKHEHYQDRDFLKVTYLPMLGGG